MTNLATTSLIDRANLDRDAVRREIARGLEGADDGELFLEYGQTEALAFDNGRLKQATYDTSQGFGLHRVELTVREDNKNAIALYRKIGFEIEGLMRDAIKVDDICENVVLMALLF